MAVLTDAVREDLGRMFTSSLLSPVKVLLFRGNTHEDFYEEQILRDVASLSPNVLLEVRNASRSAHLAKREGVSFSPAVVIKDGEGRRSITYYGLPTGYSFTSFANSVCLASDGGHGLKPETVAALARIESPVSLFVFSTPSCPYCPSVSVLAHRFALASPHLSVSVVEAIEFPEIAARFRVSSVPTVVINETVSFSGSQSEEDFLAQLMLAAGVSGFKPGVGRSG